MSVFPPLLEVVRTCFGHAKIDVNDPLRTFAMISELAPRAIAAAPAFRQPSPEPGIKFSNMDDCASVGFAGIS
jgi:hypothetical protein